MSFYTVYRSINVGALNTLTSTRFLKRNEIEHRLNLVYKGELLIEEGELDETGESTSKIFGLPKEMVIRNTTYTYTKYKLRISVDDPYKQNIELYYSSGSVRIIFNLHRVSVGYAIGDTRNSFFMNFMFYVNILTKFFNQNVMVNTEWSLKFNDDTADGYEKWVNTTFELEEENLYDLCETCNHYGHTWEDCKYTGRSRNW